MPAGGALSAAAITVEPEGGSQQPTSTPIAGGSTPEVLTVQRQLPPRALFVARALLTARVFLLLTTITAPLKAQSADAVAQERTAFAEWLGTAPASPLAALARQPIGAGLTLGPAAADIPLPGVAEHRVSETGRARCIEGSGRSPPDITRRAESDRRVRRDRRWNSRPDGGHGVRTITKAICPRLLPGHP